AFRLDTGKSWVLAGFGAAVTMLVHLSGILNVVALGVAALGVRQAIRWKRALPGVAVLALLLAPWTLGSFMAELLSLNPPSPLSSATFTDSSLERATLLVTGVGYQSIAGQAARILNATAPPFTWIDTLARGLGVAGWAWLIWSAWTVRRSDPGRAAARLLLVLMAALPVLALARPPQTGAFLTLYPYYFLNTLPALLIGIAALTDHFAARLPWLATALLAPVAGAQLLLAGPFFITHEEYWPLGDYGVPFKYTEELSRELHDLAKPEESFVLISGEEEDHSQQRLLAQVLTRQYDRVRIFDGRDGVLWRTDTPSLLIVTTNDDEVATRFLRNQFSDLQIIEQRLPGSGWTRRVFRLTATAMESWAERNLDTLVADQAAVIYSRGALADAANLGSVQIAVRWHFEADPPEPFLTKFRLAAGDRELHREEHVSYPAGTWRPGDWQATRILNLFRLPADLVLPSGTEVTITHQGILTGKTSRSGAQIKMR
ncbi:MAG: hypothetical protein HY534_06955, partial [Chloroflexi bacterium]|nr:hypothetical protein [Chloroflexota bacterium]